MWSGRCRGRCRRPAAGCEEGPETPVPSHELNRRRPAGLRISGEKMDAPAAPAPTSFFLFCRSPLRPLKIQDACFSSQDRAMKSDLMKDLIDTENHHN